MYHICFNIKWVQFSSVQSLSCVQLFVTPWTVACQAPLSMEFSRQEYWHGLPFPSPGGIRAQIPGYEIRLMRPIGGSISPDRIRTSPYAIIHWSVDSDDWNNKYYAGISDEEANARIQTIVENVMGSVTDGDIVLLHDIYESTYDATKILLQRLYEEGYV